MARLIIETAKGDERAKIGGLPIASRRTRWPGCKGCGAPMQFIGQLPMGELGIKQFQRRTQLLLLFWCQADGLCGSWGADSGANAALLVSDNHCEPMHPPPGVRALPGISYVLFRDYDDSSAIATPDDNYCAAFDRPRSRVLGKVGGAPLWLGEPTVPRCSSCGRRMAFLAQIEERGAGGLDFGGSGVGYAFACRTCVKDAAFLWQAPDPKKWAVSGNSLNDYLSRRRGQKRPVFGQLASSRRIVRFGTLMLKGRRLGFADAGQIPEAVTVRCRPGAYTLEAECVSYGADPRVARVRAFQQATCPQRGPQVGRVHVDLGQVAVFDVDSMRQFVARDSGGYEEWMESHIVGGFDQAAGFIECEPARTVIPFFTSGFGDGTYAVYTLEEGGRTVGAEAVFIEPDAISIWERCEPNRGSDTTAVTRPIRQARDGAQWPPCVTRSARWAGQWNGTHRFPYGFSRT